jgi:hypothetical protein
MAAFHQAQFFKIEGADWLVIFVVQTSRTHLVNSW